MPGSLPFAAGYELPARPSRLRRGRASSSACSRSEDLYGCASSSQAYPAELQPASASRRCAEHLGRDSPKPEFCARSVPSVAQPEPVEIDDSGPRPRLDEREILHNLKKTVASLLDRVLLFSLLKSTGDWLRGRAYPSHGWGHKFESCIAHHHIRKAPGHWGLFAMQRRLIGLP